MSEPLTALTDPENVQLELVDDELEGMSEDQAYVFLSQRDAGVTAASVPYADDNDEPTGAMIALVPSSVDVERLVIDGGEDADQLHLTLFYLGDAANVDEATQARITATIVDICQLQPVVEATGFGAAMWNPDSDYPAVVMNVGGQCNPLEQVRCTIEEALETVWTSFIPEQHNPWVPHICLAYTDDESYLGQVLERVGPITFDRIRVAWAGNVTDVLLYSAGNVVTLRGETVETLATEAPAATGTGQPVGTTPPPQGGDTMAMQGTPWEGILVVEGVETGDGRLFAEGSLTWDQPPLALRWTPADVGEHGGAVISGRIDQIWRDQAQPTIIRGAGIFDSQGVNGAEAERLVRGNFLKGVSVDVDSIKDADVELVYPNDEGNSVEEEGDGDLMMLFATPELMIFHAGRIRAVTQVDVPAFAEAQIWLTDGSMPLATDSPAPSGGGYSVNDMFAHNCTGDVNITACAVGIGAVLRDHRLKLTVAQRREHYDHLSTHLVAAGLTPLPFESTSFSEEVAALVAGLVPVDDQAPPADWFTDPQLDGPTPLTVTDDGRIFGHGALWNTFHTSFADAKVTPPREGDHVYYRQGELVCAGGERIAVGHITLGTGHAPTFGVDAHKAVEHYDNTGSVVADVASGEDRHGIWVSGAIRPGLTAGRVRELRSAQLSGDWRRIGGQLRLVAFLAVNVPGFPVPRLRTEVSAGKQLALVASGVVSHDASRSHADHDAIASMRQQLQKRLGRTPAQRAAVLRSKILGGS